LFFESYGRTDLPTGDLNALMSSLQKLRDIRGDFKVIPGHGKPTTLEHERKNNPLMRRI
jgi:glyoxylase-like metal-dependent hydrolase (beta-lactamase superfamily II)